MLPSGHHAGTGSGVLPPTCAHASCFPCRRRTTGKRRLGTFPRASTGTVTSARSSTGRVRSTSTRSQPLNTVLRLVAKGPLPPGLGKALRAASVAGGTAVAGATTVVGPTKAKATRTGTATRDDNLIARHYNRQSYLSAPVGRPA